ATSPLNATGGKLPASTTPQSGVESTGTSESSENPAEGRASPVVSAATAAFMARRPRLPPESPVSAENSEPIRIDLTRDDLGRVLAGRKLRNGAQITASGFGPRQSSPIVVENVWIRLKFEQTEGPPLVLSPKSLESARQDAFITVRHGGLEITGGAFNASATDKSGVRSFLQAVDSDLALRNCRVQGPAISGTHGRGLIQWTRAGNHPQERLFAGEFEGYAAVDNCFLVGSGTLLEADLSRRALFIRNSVLIARDDLLAVNLSSAESQVGGAIDLETTTLSAAGSFFRITAAALDIPADAPMTVFVDRCVFGPPVHSGKHPVQPTLVSYTGPLIETRQLDWWENRSGYAPDISSFLRADDAPVEPQDFERQWQNRWDAAQVIEPLTGPQGVVLNHDLPQRPEDRLKLEPADFALYPASRAATWDAGTRAIGASIADLQIPHIRPTADPAPVRSPGKRGKTSKSPPANPSKPGF
ncbi:MAG TPA: hypothetical protein VL475_07430, partial [Planctomycetaceae bacterium]|nr:hypothetical protein [Planctomycetaceae bacterium]